MLEAELIDMDNLDKLLDFTESLIRNVTLNIYDRVGVDFLSSFKKINKKTNASEIHSNFILDVISQKFIRLKYSEAVDILNRILKGKLGKTYLRNWFIIIILIIFFDLGRKITKKSIEFGEDLNKEQEKLLVEYFDNVPVFVTHYPKSLKPFYMRENLESQFLVDNFDLLAPGVGEIVGGSLREYRIDLLEKAMHKQKLDLKSYESYLETKKYGAMKMGGFGLGLERLLFDLC
jgi:asparaginyl-tRNA synthetase